MNWRAIGCLGIGLALFVGVGLLGLSFATSGAGCPERIPIGASLFVPDRAATRSPSLDSQEEGDPVEIGTTLIGLTTRRVYGPAGSTPMASGGEAPAQLAVECADGTFQTYIAQQRRGSPPGG